MIKQFEEIKILLAEVVTKINRIKQRKPITKVVVAQFILFLIILYTVWVFRNTSNFTLVFTRNLFTN